LAGDAAISLEDLVRLDNLAIRATKALGIKPAAAPKPPSIHEYVRGLEPAARNAEPAPAPAGADTVAPASASRLAAETHHEPPHGDGEASGEDAE